MKAVQISRGGCIVRSDAGARPLQLGREERKRERERKLVNISNIGTMGAMGRRERVWERVVLRI